MSSPPPPPPPTSNRSKRFRSCVSDLTNFDASENPKWRSRDNPLPCVRDMVKQIVQYQQEWEQTGKENFNNVSATTKDFLLKFIFHCNLEEGHGFGTLEETQKCIHEIHETKSKLNRSFSIKENDTINLHNAYTHLLDIKNDEKDVHFHGLIEESMLRETNKIILKGVGVQQGFTKPGIFSDKTRLTEFRGELYKYQKPEDMHATVNHILDKFNDLYMGAQSESHDEEKLYRLFKTCSWFIFEMLDLHPFGDGNGRLCRLLCSYVLSSCTPFASPIYNIFSESKKDDYKEALVEARTSDHRHPCSLTTMIIECNWNAWNNFMKKVNPCHRVPCH